MRGPNRFHRLLGDCRLIMSPTLKPRYLIWNFLMSEHGSGTWPMFSFEPLGSRVSPISAPHVAPEDVAHRRLLGSRSSWRGVAQDRINCGSPAAHRTRSGTPSGDPNRWCWSGERGRYDQVQGSEVGRRGVRWSLRSRPCLADRGKCSR